MVWKPPDKKGSITEFYFSANVGEEVKLPARVASGGEASRLMLVLKTVAKGFSFHGRSCSTRSIPDLAES